MWRNPQPRTSFGPCDGGCSRPDIFSPLSGFKFSDCRNGVTGCHCNYATVASPFFSTSDSSLSEAPEGRFSPRSHLLTRLLVTFR